MIKRSMKKPVEEIKFGFKCICKKIISSYPCKHCGTDKPLRKCSKCGWTTFVYPPDYHSHIYTKNVRPLLFKNSWRCSGCMKYYESV